MKGFRLRRTGEKNVTCVVGTVNRRVIVKGWVVRLPNRKEDPFYVF